MENFFRFEFHKIGDFAKFGSKLLKLTFILLNKFDCGNSLISIETKQKNPRFDMLLNILQK